jgi:hypothetical protein
MIAKNAQVSKVIPTIHRRPLESANLCCVTAKYAAAAMAMASHVSINLSHAMVVSVGGVSGAWRLSPTMPSQNRNA